MSTLITMDGKQAELITQELSRLTKFIMSQQKEDIYNEILDAKEAARYLKVCTRQVENLRKQKRLSFIQDGKMIRYKRSDLQKYIAEHYVKGSI
ncbi:helix-turn-helix domain-containing protein [Dyadobacter alkalitolerans]|uniref:helix-turn-helix domain-containing protein n=1 Tax=Dyadobacter alkalitolerans TaxID=492736 RepID=UPI00040EBB1C|nr:helix-turn-helix domain-containing protein [Dyadobacter alkalitolerans]